MKALLFCLALTAVSITSLSAQSRVSIAPTYWFNYNPYSYQVDMAYNGSQTHFQAAGHNIISSFGLTARYHFTPQWDVAVGALYNSSTNYAKSPQTPYGALTPFTTGGVRLPIVVSYRLTNRRLSPYLSAGATFTNNKTFTDAPINSEGVVGVGLAYRLHSGLSVLLQPTVSYSFTQPVNDAFYRTTDYSSYSVGLLTQLIWHF